MAHTKLFIAFFFAILVGLSIENDNLPQEIDYDIILNEQIDLCKKEVEKRKFKWHFKTVYDWPPEGAIFVHDDAHHADFHQGNSNNSWFISAASALMATGWINDANKDNIKARFFVDLKISQIAGMVLFDPKTKLPVCITVRPEMSARPAWRLVTDKPIQYAKSDRNQMYIEMLEKVAASLYRIYYAQLEWGNSQEGHYVITGNSECRTYSDCHLPIECPTRTDLESVLFEELGSKTAAVTATTKISEKFYGPKEDDFENVGLSVPHNYVVVKMERIYGKFKPDGEAKSHTVLKLYDPKISYENKLKWKGAFNVSSDFWTLNPEAKTEFLDKLKDGEFFAEIQEFKSYFHTVTACNVQSENENASFFMASFPVKYDDLSNMFGYEFEVPEGQKMATMSFHLMERIPRLYKKPLIENYPAVIAVFKKLENSSYEIFKTSCFENAFSNSIVAESYPAGKYVAVPFSVSPLTSEFHKEFDPKYTLKINSVEFKPEIKPQPISSNDYWGLFTDYVDSRLTGTISICPQGETDCKARHIQLYKMKAEGPLEIFVVHNPLDYAVEVKLDLYNFPEEDYLYSFWRGTFREHTEDNKRYFYRQTLDIVQPKTSYIANIVWHKYPSAQYVRFSLEAYKDFSDQQSTSVKPLYIAQKQTKLPESTPYDVIYKSITPLIEMPKCRHNVVS